MTTTGGGLYQYGGVPVGFPTYGKVFHVRPDDGSSANTGKSPKSAKSTLSGALSVMTADQNDVVYFYGEGNSSSECTDYLSTTLDWNKDLCHIIGVHAGGIVSPRARVAWLSTATSTTDIPLFTLSANGCQISNMQFYSGIDDANLSFNVNVTGDRNRFSRCHFAGIGHDTNDASGAYSLRITGSENLFEDCVIGLDTIARGTAANSEILFASGGTGARNIFRNCYIITYAEAATHQFVTKEASSIDRFVLFDNCVFINAVKSGATTMTEAIDVTAGGSPNGMLIFKDCSFFGVTDVEAAVASGEVYLLGHSTVAADNSIGGVTVPA